MELKRDNKITLLVSDCCNLRCSQCLACCNISSVNKFLNKNDINNLCSDIKQSGHKFTQLVISGGEPMLNPEIMEIINILIASNLAKEYQMMTNGTINKCLITEIEKKIKIVNSHKTLEEPYQSNHMSLYTVAPIDINLFGERPLENCFLLKYCGIGYSRGGFYPCVVSPVIGRIFGINGIRYWKDINYTNMVKLLWQTCRYCGYYLGQTNGTNCDLLPKYKYPSSMITDSWKKALEWYNNLPKDQK